MIELIAERLTGYLVSKDIIEKEEIDVYKYGYEILTSSLLGGLLILVVSILLHQVDVAMFFLCVVCGVRSYSGGYHADTYLKCNTTFVCMYVTYTCAVNYLCNVPNVKLSLIVMCVISTLIICKYAPLENHNKPLSKDNIKRNGNKTKVSICIWHIVAMLLYLEYSKYSIAIEVSLLCVALLLVIGKIKEQKYAKSLEMEEKYEE